MDDKPIKVDQRYVDAIDKIISNLRASDFVSTCGTAAIDALLEYRMDMALDLHKSLADHT